MALPAITSRLPPYGVGDRVCEAGIVGAVVTYRMTDGPSGRRQIVNVALDSGGIVPMTVELPGGAAPPCPRISLELAAAVGLAEGILEGRTPTATPRQVMIMLARAVVAQAKELRKHEE